MDDSLVDEEDVLTREEQAFYSEIRGLVVVFLFFVILFTIAHLTVQYFAARPDPDVKQDRADRFVHQLVSGICTFTLTISLTGYSLLPFSIAANEVLLGFPHSYYVQWLDTDLVKDLSLIVNVGTKIACLLLPFSYFLLIAQGFTASVHSFSSRLIEATSLLIFSYILVFGTIWSLGSVLVAVHTLVVGSPNAVSTTAAAAAATPSPPPNGRLPPTTGTSNITSLLSTQHPVEILVHSIQTLSWTEFLSKIVLHTVLRMLESVQLVASLLGLVLLFACTPIGLVSLGFYLITASIQALPPNWISQAALRDRLAELHFDALCLEDDLRTAELMSSTSSLSSFPTRWYDRLSVLTCQKRVGLLTTSAEDGAASHAVGEGYVFPLARAKLPQIRQEMNELQERISRHATSPVLLVRDWSRPLVPCLVFAVIFCLLQLTQSYVFFNILDLIWNLLFGGPEELSGTFTSPAALTKTTTTTALAPSLMMLGESRAALSRTSTSGFTLGHKPVSAFGHIGAVLQICVIQFLLFVSLWGFYTCPTGSFLRPRAHNMSLESIMANVVLLLLFSSALPLQSNLLGLTTMTLPSALKTKEAAIVAFSNLPHPTPQESTPLTSNVLEKTDSESGWWLWSWRAQTSSSSSAPFHSTIEQEQRILCTKHCHLDQNQVSTGADGQVETAKEPAGDQPFWSKIWHVFVPVSFYPSTSYVDWTGDLGVSRSVPDATIVPNRMPTVPGSQTLDDRSIWSQFISRAFGVSSPASASCGLIVVILLYNLCFLITSVWIAGRRLSDATWSFSLELVTSLRCLQQIQWAGSQEGLPGALKNGYARTSHPDASTSSGSSAPVMNGVSCQLTVDNRESQFHLPCGK